VKKSANAKTQQRSVETREFVIKSVVELISERGFSGVSTANVAGASGYSWGVLQYQFGGKTGLLLEVIKFNIQELKDVLDTVDLNTLAPEKKISKLIDILWHYYSAPSYRASIEILFNCSNESDEFLNTAYEAKEILENFCVAACKGGYPKASKKQIQNAVDLLLSSLRGYGIGAAIFPNSGLAFEAERKQLANIVNGLLG